MNIIISIIAKVVLLLIIPTGFFCLDRVHLGHPYFFLFASGSFVLGALFLGIAQLVFDRHAPAVNLRTLQSSVSLSLVGVILPTLIFAYLAKTQAPVLLGLTFCLSPFCLGFWGVETRGKLLGALAGFLLGLTALYAVYFGSRFTLNYQGFVVLSLMTLLPLFYSLAVAFIRKVFWIHSATSLTLGAYFFASIFFLVASLIFEDISHLSVAKFPWGTTLAFGAGFLGLGCYLYETYAFSSQRSFAMAFALLLPLSFIASDVVISKSLFLNPQVVTGILLFLGCQVFLCVTEKPVVFLSHYLGNTKRKGERVTIEIEAFADCGLQKNVPVSLRNISVGGIGFIAPEKMEVSERVVITVPLGKKWTQITLEGQIVFVDKVSHSKFPFAMGCQFDEYEDEAHARMVEFIAQLGNLKSSSDQEEIKAA